MGHRGAEVSFANQNIMHYESETDTFHISLHMKRVVSLLVARQIGLNFKSAINPMTAEEIADKMDLPVRLIRDILYELQEVDIISETVTPVVKENAYQPACNTDKLTVNYVLNKLERRGKDSIDTDKKDDLRMMAKIVDKYGEIFEKTPENKLLVDI